MDKEEKKQRFDWLPTQMPGVSRLIAEKRREVGTEWVNTCWRRGVVEREPGWFFAGEGALMIGTLWDDATVIAYAAARITPTQAMLIIRPLEVANGAH